MIFREVVQQTTLVPATVVDGEPVGAVRIEGDPCVSTVPVFEDEVDEQLRLSVGLHTIASWTVTINPSTRVAVCRKMIDDARGLREVVRTIWFEASDPSTDGGAS